MTTKTWIIYKTASSDAFGWEERQIMPGNSLTSILAEELDWSGEMPKVGERVREYENLEDPGNGVTHGRDSAWVVSEVQFFTSPDTDTRVVICLCEYQPIETGWQLLNRGAPLPELVEA